ncbi:hypothetical protein Ahy_B10g100449 isoform D [Arachis hypogaea]|uniref:RRM domain-containing protein n=1 Tax=Arachis hypogaea TaxID=3818 RepID=A0A444WWM2_ARAHY|nr:hypothetical protein Ahy_B10g100449 isoform D [Arachis hypogaea]
MEGGDDSPPPSAASPPWHGDHAGASDPDLASGPEDIAGAEFHDLLTEEEQHHTDLNHDLDHDHDDDHEHAPEPETTDVSFDDLKLKIIKQRLSRDHSVIAAALQESSVLVVSSDGKRVKRVNPFRFKESRDHKLYTVLVENLPEDHSKDNLQRIFREAGNIRRISIYDPRSAAESTKHKQETFFSSKLHALVEYDTIESAEKADGDHLAKDNKGGHRPRSHGRSRKQKYRAANGIGHGSTSSTHVMEAPKPPPGPKMPDGTRGFAMGRGRPPVPAPN